MKITAVAQIKAKTGMEQRVKHELWKLIAPTIEEEACLGYEIHQALDDPQVFLSHENWETRAGFEAHLEQPYVKAVLDRGEELFEGPVEITLWQKITEPVSMPASVSLKGENGESTSYDLAAAVTTVGRHPHSSVLLDDGTASLHHAEIFMEDGAYYVRDLNSSNGTFINGKRIDKEAVHHGDVIHFAGAEALFSNESERKKPAAEPEGLKTKIMGIGQAVVTAAKRHSHLATLKDQIKQVQTEDLPRAYHMLGRKACELRVHRDRLAVHYGDISYFEREIRETQREIEAERDEREKKKLHKELETQELHLRNRVEELGKEIARLAPEADLKTEFDFAQELETRMGELEEEHRKLRQPGGQKHG